jgi:hypothetical protein
MEGDSRRWSYIRGLTACWQLDLPSSDVAKELNASAWNPVEGVNEGEVSTVAMEVDVEP